MNTPLESRLSEINHGTEFGQATARTRKFAALAAGLLLTMTGCNVANGEIPDRVDEVHAEPTVPLTELPNIIKIKADDLDKKPMRYMKIINKLIRDEGVTLTNFQVEKSTCCPSRASDLTGKYSHNTGVNSNVFPTGGFLAFHNGDESSAMPVWLQDKGYTTGLVGKYLNQYPVQNGFPERGVSKTMVPPGWDKWASPVTGNPYVGFNYKLNVNGVVDEQPRIKFMGDVTTNIALRMLKNMPDDKPFYLEVDPYTPHGPYAYPKRFKDEFKNVTYPRSPNYNEKDMSDKPNYAQKRPSYTQDVNDEVDRAFRRRLRGMKVVDAMVGKIIEQLEITGELDNTYIIFTSDNGYLLGEHRKDSKYDQHKESLNVPFLIRGPGIPKGKKIHDLVSVIDVAPTIADIANAKPKLTVDGVSLLPTLTQSTKIERGYVLFTRPEMLVTTVKNASGVEEPSRDARLSIRETINNAFNGVISSDGFKYVEFEQWQRFELYDMNNDPYELDNLLGPKGDEELLGMSEDMQVKVRDMREALNALKECQGKECSIPLAED